MCKKVTLLRITAQTHRRSPRRDSKVTTRIFNTLFGKIFHNQNNELFTYTSHVLLTSFYNVTL
jgi:hypothetical protein